MITIIVMAFNAFVFWPGRWSQSESIFLSIIVAPLNLVWGLTLATANTFQSLGWVMGFIIAIIGFFCLFRAGVMLFNFIKKPKEARTDGQ
jgi:hypothetical protein